MSIIKTISEQDFINEFKNWDTYANKFTRNGLIALYEYLDNLSIDTGEPIELDIVSIACDYTEYRNFDEFKDDYDNYRQIETFEELNEYTTVIPVDNAMKTEAFVIANF